MPYSNYKRRKGRKTRKVSNRKLDPRSIVSTSRGVIGFPDVYRTRLTYTTKIAQALTAVNSYNAIQTFRANSLFDPDYTSTGTQPLYFDELSGIYERYRVKGVWLSIQLINLGSGNPVAMCVSDSTSPTLTYNATETSMEGTSASPLMVCSSEGSQNVRKYSKYYSVSGVMGVTPSAVQSENNFSSLISDNPASQGYLHIQTESLNSTSTNVLMICQLTYNCEFYQSEEVPPS